MRSPCARLPRCSAHRQHVLLFRWLSNPPLCASLHVTHPLISWWTLGLFPLFSFYYPSVCVGVQFRFSELLIPFQMHEGTWLRTGDSGTEVSLGFRQQTPRSPVRSRSCSWSSLSETAAQRRTPAGGSPQGLDFQAHSAHYWLQLPKPFMSHVLMWADKPLFPTVGCFSRGWFWQLCHACLLSRAGLHKYLNVLLPVTLLSSSEWVLHGRGEPPVQATASLTTCSQDQSEQTVQLRRENFACRKCWK